MGQAAEETDNNFHRTSAWSELNNQSTYGLTDNTTRTALLPTTRISTQFSGEQPSRPFPPQLKLFFSFLSSSPSRLQAPTLLTTHHFWIASLPITTIERTNRRRFNPHTTCTTTIAKHAIKKQAESQSRANGYEENQSASRRPSHPHPQPAAPCPTASQPGPNHHTAS